MITVRFPTDGPQFLTLKHRDQLDKVPFEVVDRSTGALRLPLPPMTTLADLDAWMCEYGYTLTNQRADFRGRRGRQHHVIADLVRDPRPDRPLPPPASASLQQAKAQMDQWLKERGLDGEPKPQPPSIRLTLLDAYATGNLTHFGLSSAYGWTLHVIFDSIDAARHFAKRQAKARGVKVVLRIQDPDVFIVKVPVQVAHRPHPNASMSWSVAGMSEPEFIATVRTAGLIGF